MNKLVRHSASPENAHGTENRLPLRPRPCGRGSCVYAPPSQHDKPQPASFVPATKVLTHSTPGAAHTTQQTYPNPHQTVMGGRIKHAAEAHQPVCPAKAYNAQQIFEESPGKQAWSPHESQQNLASHLLPAYHYQRQQNSIPLASAGCPAFPNSVHGRTGPIKEFVPPPANQRFPWPAHFPASTEENAAPPGICTACSWQDSSISYYKSDALRIVAARDS